MKQTIRRLTIAAGALGAMALPMAAQAQQAARREPPRADVTRILNLRRVLDLTPRQVAQLDSMERVQHAARRATMERMRGQMVARRDSMRPARMRTDSARPRMTPEQRNAARDSMRATMLARREAMRPQMEEARRRDSVTRAAAERVLNDTQRQKLRELQAEERGRQRGLREARGERGGRVMMRGQRMMRGERMIRERQGMRPTAPRAPQARRLPPPDAR